MDHGRVLPAQPNMLFALLALLDGHADTCCRQDKAVIRWRESDGVPSDRSSLRRKRHKHVHQMNAKPPFDGGSYLYVVSKIGMATYTEVIQFANNLPHFHFSFFLRGPLP